MLLTLTCPFGCDLHPGPRVWQIILKDSPIIVLFIPKFSAHYSSIILKQYHAASQELIAMTCAFKFSPKTTVFLCIHAMCKALKSSLCPFKVGISGYSNLQTMSTGKWATSEPTTKVWVKLLLM